MNEDDSIRCFADTSVQGSIADSVVKKIRETGGIFTREDLANYKVHVNRALEGTYRGKKVYTSHAPTSGPVLLHMLNLMEHYDGLEAEGRTLLNTHRYIEAMKCECWSVWSMRHRFSFTVPSSRIRGKVSLPPIDTWRSFPLT